MRVVIAGGHGQIALHLEKVLAERGDEPVGIVRNPDQVARWRRSAPKPSCSTCEHSDVDGPGRGARRAPDAVVFAAGGGPAAGTPARRAWTRAPRCCWPTPPSRPGYAAT